VPRIGSNPAGANI